MIVLLLFVVIAFGVPVAVEAVKRPSDNLLVRSKEEILESPEAERFMLWIDSQTEAVRVRLDSWKQEVTDQLIHNFIASVLRSVWQWAKKLVNSLFR